MDANEYSLPDFNDSVSRAELAKANREKQLAVMRTWFFQNYEDPAERTPYESREGGYIWIWGGPYEAREELDSEFYGVVPTDVIEELARELDGCCPEWAPTENPGDYDVYVVDDIAKITEYYRNFSSSIRDIKSLLRTTVDGAVERCFYKLLYVNVITALETYLSDAFINSIMNEKPLMRSFIESTPEFKVEKLSLSDVYRTAEEIDDKAKRYMAAVVWHNLGRVKPMYRDALGVSFPKDISGLMKAVVKRHDIVHRNGKSFDGKEIVIFREDVTELIDEAEAFVQDIDQKISHARANNWANNDAQS